MREVSRRRYRWVRATEKERVVGRLPSFSRSLGLDVIITEAGRPVLVELQHGFGRRGLMTLFPKASRSYRQTYWRFRRECGRSQFAAEELRKICSDKIQTYKRVGQFQPRSFVFHRWGAKVEAWLDGLDSEYVLSKPPRGSCGAGIKVFQRSAFRRSGAGLDLGSPPLLLQEFIESRPLMDQDDRPHLGCIRHIMVLRSDGESLETVHLPPYWRVSPLAVPEDQLAPDGDVLIANISRGAYPLAVEAADAQRVRELAETVVDEVLKYVFKLERITHGERVVISGAGEPISLAQGQPSTNRHGGGDHGPQS